MNAYFPSQIVEYIDNKFPHVKSSLASGRDDLGVVTKEYYPVISLLSVMIESVPSKLIILKGDALTEYFEAVEALKMAVKLWGQGDKNYAIEHIPGRKNKHPIVLVRKHLSTLSDEGIDPETATLSFIADKQLNDSLRTDISAADSALGNGEWKAATVLSGSIIETMLLYVIKEHKNTNPAQISQIIKTLTSSNTIKDVPSDIDKWNLHILIEVALALKTIDDSTAALCRITRGFRNLIHPGRAMRLAQVCDRGTALSALGAVVHVIRDLNKP